MPQSTKLFSKRISSPIAIAVVALCAVLVGVLVWQYGLVPKYEFPSIKVISNKERKEETEEKSKEKLEESSKEKTKETPEWKVYRNEKYRFEVSYPSTFQIEELSPTSSEDLGVKPRLFGISVTNEETVAELTVRDYKYPTAENCPGKIQGIVKVLGEQRSAQNAKSQNLERKN